MRGTSFFTCGVRSSRDVMKFSPDAFALVVMMGLPYSFTRFWIQWLGMRTPKVSIPRLTFCATGLSFLSLRMSVYGPGSFSIHSSASCVRTQWVFIQFLFGAMIEKGWWGRFFISLTFCTSSWFVASQPIP